MDVHNSFLERPVFSLAAGLSQLGSLKCIIVYFGTAQAREWEIGPSLLIPRSGLALTRVGEYLGKQTLNPSTLTITSNTYS
jgi:hypothetical protein